MAFDGVIAFQGKNHITASQLGRLIEGTAGEGRYVLPTQNQLSATMATANKVVIGTGDLVMDGRYVTNEANVELAVESGVTGYKRNDIVAIKYEKNQSTGVESFEPVVVKGEAVTDAAKDPTVTEGDISAGSAEAYMPLWRIPIDGLTPKTPERIAPVTSTLKSLGESVSQAKLDLASTKEITDRFGFSSGAGVVLFHAWDTGMQINVNDKIIAVDKNGINFYLGGDYIWHK